MKKLTILFLLTAVVASFFFLTSCYYDNEEYLYPGTQGPAGCDTLNVTYTLTVAPVLATHCNNCHNPADPRGGVIVDRYDELIKVVNNGSFWGSINHDKDYSPMPRNSKKLSDCNLLRIKKWIDDGALNN